MCVCVWQIGQRDALRRAKIYNIRSRDAKAKEAKTKKGGLGRGGGGCAANSPGETEQ